MPAALAASARMSTVRRMNLSSSFRTSAVFASRGMPTRLRENRCWCNTSRRRRPRERGGGGVGAPAPPRDALPVGGGGLGDPLEPGEPPIRSLLVLDAVFTVVEALKLRDVGTGDEGLPAGAAKHQHAEIGVV